jgi:hypothetical protein
MRDPKKEIGSYLQGIRVVRGKTVKEMAALSDGSITASNITSWECWQSLPPLWKASEIARVYGLDEEEFAGRLQEASEEQKRLNSARKTPKIKGPSEMVFSGGISRNREFIRTNYPGWTRNRG